MSAERVFCLAPQLVLSVTVAGRVVKCDQAGDPVVATPAVSPSEVERNADYIDMPIPQAPWGELKAENSRRCARPDHLGDMTIGVIGFKSLCMGRKPLLRGHAVIGASPFKCPPAPSECALMLNDYLESRGVRGECEISFVLPLSTPVPPSGSAHRPG